MTTREVYVLYDYGQGGLWAIVLAESAKQVRDRFPQLQVFEEAPTVLEPEVLDKIRQSGVYRYDDLRGGWLADFAANHPGSAEI